MSSTRCPSPELQASLLAGEQNGIQDDVDLKGSHPKPSLGGWRSASFMLGGGILETFTFYGIEANLVNFLTGPLHQSVATAAVNVHTWFGLCKVVPILGAVLADSYIGRYRSAILFGVFYTLGVGLLTLSAAVVGSSAWNSVANEESGHKTKVRILFFVSIYIVALSSGYKVCLQAFGADQFDEEEYEHLNLAEKSLAKNSFFNWWNGGVYTGAVAAHVILHYIQDYISWEMGFGIPFLAMIFGLFLLLSGSRTYRSHKTVEDEERSKVRMTRKKFLHKLSPEADQNSTHYKVYVMKLLPIWITSLACTVANAQISTFFIKQATTVDRSIGPNLVIPSATLRTFVSGSFVLCIAIYDRILVPVARRVTGRPSSITMLQRIGTGMAVTTLNMVVAALVEKKRLETARDHGLIDEPNAVVPMSFWWLVPQFMLVGLAFVLTVVGMQELFYDQIPKELKSVGLSACVCAIGMGSFLSSFLVWVVDKVSSQNGSKQSWFPNNLNRAHIDYFYWLLAGISFAGFIGFLHFSSSYDYEVKHDFKLQPVELVDESVSDQGRYL